jgi:hypothetical protein
MKCIAGLTSGATAHSNRGRRLLSTYLITFMCSHLREADQRDEEAYQLLSEFDTLTRSYEDISHHGYLLANVVNTSYWVSIFAWQINKWEEAITSANRVKELKIIWQESGNFNGTDHESQSATHSAPNMNHGVLDEEVTRHIANADWLAAQTCFDKMKELNQKMHGADSDSAMMRAYESEQYRLSAERVWSESQFDPAETLFEKAIQGVVPVMKPIDIINQYEGIDQS